MFKWLLMGLCFLLPSTMSAGVINYSIDISNGDIKMEMFNHYDYVSIGDYEHLVEPGHPALPAKVLSFVIPADAEFKGIEIVSEQGEYLSGNFDIFPAQKPVPVSFSKDDEFTQPNAKVYSLNTLYPKNAIQFLHSGDISGYRIVSVLVTPLRYNPAMKKLYLSNHIEFRMNYQSDEAHPKTITEAQMKLAQGRVINLVANKEQVEMFAPPSRKGFWQTEYFIITHQTFVDAFKPLKQWKMRRGVPTEIISTSWIYSNYTGDDNPEKIRNFIIEAADSGAMYFLFAGQCDFEHGEEYVPRRDVYCMISGAGYYNDEDTIPCDMYFSDLDGDWDGNSNGIYGEMADMVNMYSDVYVGRAPVKNTTMISNFISKIITYEKCPDSSFIEKILLPVGNLWAGNYGNGINDTIADTIPDDWKKAKIYQSLGLMSRWVTRDSINQGYHFCHMVGHGNEYGMYYNYGTTIYYYHSDAGTQSNDSTDAVISNSMGCFCGAVDEAAAGASYDCMAEHMVNDNKKCATATMMNSRYGWGYSSPQGALGPSGELDVWFYRKLFGTNAYHLGEVLAASKDQKIPWAGDPYWRWSIYEINLFGDPEMPLWTDAPKNLTVSLSSDTVTQNFTVTVEHSGSPVSNALVTIMQDSTAYFREFTNGSGQAQFSFDNTSFEHEGYAWVTATKYSDNFLPCLDSAFVPSDLNVDELPADNYTQFNIMISPNPVKNTINLSLGAPVNNDLMVKIYDIQGSLVKSIKLNTGMSDISISTSELCSGIYFLKADEDITINEKIIIVK